MGSKLKSDASTFEISQGLMSGDLEKTADAIEQLADQLDQMPDDTRKEISETLTEQAGKLDEMQMENASIELNEAADAIADTISKNSEPKNLMVPSDSRNSEYYQGFYVIAQEKLDQIAQSLREISDQLDDQLSNNNSDGAGIETVKYDAGTVISNQEKSSPQEINRLESIAGEFQFNPGYESGSPLTGIPGDASDISDEQIGINQSAYMLSNNYFINYIVPYYYPWKWHNVVSKYFQRN
jgi:hypothetical protein